MTSTTRKLLTLAGVTLTSARLTRLVTTDKLGQWLIQEPVDALLSYYYAKAEREAVAVGKSPVEPWWWRYRAGLYCQWCVGFWLTLGTVTLERVTRNSPATLRVPLEVFGTALAINYVSATIETLNPANSAVVGDTSENHLEEQEKVAHE